MCFDVLHTQFWLPDTDLETASLTHLCICAGTRVKKHSQGGHSFMLFLWMSCKTWALFAFFLNHSGVQVWCWARLLSGSGGFACLEIDFFALLISSTVSPPKTTTKC